MTRTAILWTRRGLLATAGLAATAPAAAQVLNARAAQHLPPESGEAIPLPARTDAAQRLTLEVRINGRGPYRFVVDTAAERSVIADTVAAELGLPLGEPVLVDGLSSRISVPTATVERLDFGPFSHGNLRLPVLRRGPLLADGYLGLDVIDGTRVTFDFAGHSLRVEPGAASALPPGDGLHSTQVRARGSHGRLRIVDCLVDSVAAIAILDTGAEVSVGNISLKQALKRRIPRLVETGTMTLTGVTGGEITGDVIPVGRIRLQNLAFTNGSLVIADVPEFRVWKARYRPALLIGMDYLRQFSSLAIDYRAKVLRFELSRAPPAALPGIEIERT